MKVLKRENLYSGFLGLDQVLIELDNGEKIVREIINKKDTVGIIAMNDNDEIYFTIQPRAGIDKSNSIELPGGLINEHELPIEAAKRELLEETGCVCDSIELFQKYVADPACCNSVSYIFLAKGAKKMYPGAAVLPALRRPLRWPWCPGLRSGCGCLIPGSSFRRRPSFLSCTGE